MKEKLDNTELKNIVINNQIKKEIWLYTRFYINFIKKNKAPS